jgi:phage baseplate assembly protein V
MLKFGKIDAIQPETGRARVRFEDNGMVSDWIPMVVRKSKADKDFYMFDVGDHVACTMDERCENGIIHGAIYDDTNKPSGVTADTVGVQFSDGSKVTFDRATGKYTVDMKGEVTLKSVSKVKVDCNLEVAGNITAQGITASGDVNANGDVIGNNVKAVVEVTAKYNTLPSRLTTHMHPTAAPGPPSPPTPGT